MSYIPASDSQYSLNASGTTINPATDETVQLLRRMVKLLEPLAVQDSSQRQRVTVENSTVTVVQPASVSLNATVLQSNPAQLNATVSQATATNLNATVVQPTATNLNATVVQPTATNLNANVGNIAGLGGVDPRFQFMEAARISYATGVRTNLQFS